MRLVKIRFAGTVSRVAPCFLRRPILHRIAELLDVLVLIECDAGVRVAAVTSGWVRSVQVIVDALHQWRGVH
jgi:hypothetical protein